MSKNPKVVFVDAPVIITPTPKRNEAVVVTIDNDNELIPGEGFKKLYIEWATDYNIVQLHQQIIGYLKHKKARKELLIARNQELSSRSSEGLTTMELSDIQSLIVKNNEEIQLLDKLSMLEYVSKTKPMIEEYKRLSVAKVLVMGEQPKIDMISYRRKIEIVEAYFNIAKNHCPMTVVKKIQDSGLCKICNGTIIDNGENFSCVICNAVQRKIENSIEQTNTDMDVNLSVRKAEKDGNAGYHEIVMIMADRFPYVIPEKVYVTIREALSSYQGITLETLTKKDLYTIMRDTGLGNHYKYINKIYSVLTGVPMNDYTKYVDQLLVRGNLIFDVYNEVKDKERSNFIHRLYLVWINLRNEGLDPDMDDFIMLKSRQSELQNLEVMEKAFSILRVRQPKFQWRLFQIG